MALPPLPRPRFDKAYIERILSSLVFRVFFAAALLGIHIFAATTMGRQRFNVPFDAAPHSPPAFVHPTDKDAVNWNRLVLARWDSGWYVSTAIHGDSSCPPGSLRGKDLRGLGQHCTIVFPLYPLLGHLATLGGRVPADFALLGVSLLCSFSFLFLWTGRTMRRRLGVFGAYLSLLLFNAFTTGFMLVFIVTEPVASILTLGAFIAFDRRHLTLSAFLAGAATGARVNCAAVGFAYAVALAVLVYRERPKTVLAWTGRALQAALAGWGLVAMLVYHQLRFDDPLIYFHAHEQGYGHTPGLGADPEILLRSLDMPLHEGIFILLTLIFFLAGRQAALRGFDPPGRAFWYAIVIVGLGISLAGSYGLTFAGMNRYELAALPIFFAMAAVMRRRPLLLVLWLVFSAWHYWQIDLCFYVGGPGDATLRACHEAHWVGHL